MNDTSQSGRNANTAPSVFVSPARKLARQIALAAGSRLLLNTGRRFAYPFAPALSRGLGVPLTAVTNIIAVMQLSGILSVVSGPLTDRWGYRRMMLFGIGLMAVGMLAVWAVPTYGVLMAGLVLAGFAKNIFDPAVYGYTSRNVPFNQRGKVVGILEFPWAGSALVGIPAVGFLIAYLGWQSPFLCMGLAAVFCFLLILVFIPKDHGRQTSAGDATFASAWRELLKQRPAIGLLGFVFWVSLGNDQVFVVYGAWMEKTFGIGIAALGMGTGVIGVAELIGEGLTATIGDRIGLKRATLIGTAIAATGYAVLPFLSINLPLALAGLFILFLALEFSMVCGISLSTEALPQYRATMMSAFFCSAGFGRVIGAMIGGPVWTYGGMGAIGSLSAAASVLGFLSLMWGISSPRHTRRAG